MGILDAAPEDILKLLDADLRSTIGPINDLGELVFLVRGLAKLYDTSQLSRNFFCELMTLPTAADRAAVAENPFSETSERVIGDLEGGRRIEGLRGICKALFDDEETREEGISSCFTKDAAGVGRFCALMNLAIRSCKASLLGGVPVTAPVKGDAAAASGVDPDEAGSSNAVRPMKQDRVDELMTTYRDLYNTGYDKRELPTLKLMGRIAHSQEREPAARFDETAFTKFTGQYSTTFGGKVKVTPPSLHVYFFSPCMYNSLVLLHPRPLVSATLCLPQPLGPLLGRQARDHRDHLRWRQGLGGCWHRHRRQADKDDRRIARL